ncbi:hypothetical protein U3516DRAFT_777459 [Neocallimastix sp. 'constans']
MISFELKFISIGTNKITNGITGTLPGHKDVVNGVKFLKFEKVLVSYSQDKANRIWKLNSQNKVILNPNNLLIASSVTDSTIKIWNYVINDSEK